MEYNKELSTKNTKEGQNKLNYNSIKRAIGKGIATIGIAAATIFAPVYSSGNEVGAAYQIKNKQAQEEIDYRYSDKTKVINAGLTNSDTRKMVGSAGLYGKKDKILDGNFGVFGGVNGSKTLLDQNYSDWGINGGGRYKILGAGVNYGESESRINNNGISANTNTIRKGVNIDAKIGKLKTSARWQNAETDYDMYTPMIQSQHIKNDFWMGICDYDHKGQTLQKAIAMAGKIRQRQTGMPATEDYLIKGIGVLKLGEKVTSVPMAGYEVNDKNTSISNILIIGASKNNKTAEDLAGKTIDSTSGVTNNIESEEREQRLKEDNSYINQIWRTSWSNNGERNSFGVGVNVNFRGSGSLLVFGPGFSYDQTLMRNYRKSTLGGEIDLLFKKRLQAGLEIFQDDNNGAISYGGRAEIRKGF